MKPMPFLLACLLSVSLKAQITIDHTDFADAGDTARMSVAVWNPLLDYGATGANYTWDFSSLQWQSQYVEEILNPLYTGPTYAFTFSNLPINPYRCNLAKRAENVLTTLPILSSLFTEGHNFYYKTSAMYRQRGIGMKISGFPTPVPFTHADTLYRFPISYGNTDSSWSDFKVGVPNLGAYAHRQYRHNKTDGWGTLTTPYGTFDVVRMVTEIRSSDSLFIDTLNMGFKMENDIQREYKWFGKNQKVPLLQINTQAGIFGQFQGIEFVTKIVYRDSVRFEPTGVLNMNSKAIPFTVFPNPSNGTFYISIPQENITATAVITDMNGQQLTSKQLSHGVNAIDITGFAKGLYFVTVKNAQGLSVQKIILQ